MYVERYVYMLTCDVYIIGRQEADRKGLEMDKRREYIEIYTEEFYQFTTIPLSLPALYCEWAISSAPVITSFSVVCFKAEEIYIAGPGNIIVHLGGGIFMVID